MHASMSINRALFFVVLKLLQKNLEEQGFDNGRRPPSICHMLMEHHGKVMQIIDISRDDKYARGVFTRQNYLLKICEKDIRGMATALHKHYIFLYYDYKFPKRETKL